MVLTIIGLLAIIYILFLFVEYVNRRSRKYYRYEFFTYENLAVVTSAYILLFFGHNMYIEALNNNGDMLNGELLMGIGVLIVLSLLLVHVSSTSVGFGLFFGFIQLLIYIPAGIVSFIGLIMLIAWLMDTKPVYRL